MMLTILLELKVQIFGRGESDDSFCIVYLISNVNGTVFLILSVVLLYNLNIRYINKLK